MLVECVEGGGEGLKAEKLYTKVVIVFQFKNSRPFRL